MKPKFMLDTNICIHLIKHHPPEVAERFAQCFLGDLIVSAVTPAELEHGVTCSGESEARNRAALDAFLEDVAVVAFDGAAARAYGPARYAARERRRDALDKLIAAHATALELVLVTNIEADFVAFPGLRIENWVKSH